MNSVELVLTPVPPFRLDLTVWVLRRRPENAIDRWDGRTYRRALVIEGRPVELAVTQAGPADNALLKVVATGVQLPQVVESETEAVLERLLGLRIDLSQFYEFATSDATLMPVAQRFYGFKPTRYPTLFEALVNGITCQQISLNVGIRLLSRLAKTCGADASGEGASGRLFPQPGDIAALSQEVLRGLGYSRQKIRSLLELSAAAGRGRLDMEQVQTLDDEAAIDWLQQLRGVGRWTAEYVLLRGMGRLHIFPGNDVGARNGLKKWLGLKESPDHEQVRQTLASWRPYAGLVYFHMLLDHLAAAGYVQ